MVSRTSRASFGHCIGSFTLWALVTEYLDGDSFDEISSEGREHCMLSPAGSSQPEGLSARQHSSFGRRCSGAQKTKFTIFSGTRSRIALREVAWSCFQRQTSRSVPSSCTGSGQCFAHLCIVR